jgi:hypothetical protein
MAYVQARGLIAVQTKTRVDASRFISSLTGYRFSTSSIR